MFREATQAMQLQFGKDGHVEMWVVCLRVQGGEMLNGRSSFPAVGSKPQGLNHRAIR